MLNTFDFEKFLEGQFLEVLFKLVIIYGVSVLFSVFAKHFKQPVVLGHIIGGIVLGLIVGARTPITWFIDFFNGFTIDGKTLVIYDLSKIGVILLLFMAGLQTNYEKLKANFARSSLIAFLGILFTIILIFVATFLIEGNGKTAIAIAVVLSSTSVSISVQTLKEMGKLQSRHSVLSTGAAIIDDIIGLLLITLLGIFMNPQFNGLDQEFFMILGRIMGLFLVIALLGVIVVKMNEKIIGHSYYVKYHDQILMAVLAFCFIMAYMAQLLGVSVIIGAYFAGLMLSMTKLKMPIEKNLTSIVELFFAPLFFMSIGLSLDLNNIAEVFFVGVLIALLAVAGKVAGCGLGVLLTGGSRKSSMKVGFAMIPKGEVSIITASLAAGMGLLTDSHLSIVVIVLIITSVITPVFLKKAYGKNMQ